MKTNECLSKNPVNATLKAVGGKWKPLILWHLTDKEKRFSELLKLVEGVTQKMLTQQLREMESDALIQRKIYPVVPPKVEYSLTAYGKTLLPVLEAMASWGRIHSKSHAK